MIRDTLLVIDDSPLDLAILREIFRSLFQVKCFEESRPALSYIHRNPERICAVLLDLCLGKRGAGFTVLQQLQAAEKTWDVPVILITSDAQEEQVLKAVRTGAADFIVKPVDPVTVQERVCSAVYAAWPAGSTILDCPLTQPDNAPQAPQDDHSFLLADHWDRLLELFLQARPHFPLAKYHALGQITAALASGYRKNNPNCPLTQEDVQLIGRAAVYCDVGLLGIPDTVIEQGPDQGGTGQQLYLRHTELGHALFTTGPSSSHPLSRYAAEIAYWHHKNFDGTGYPTEQTPNPLPLSAQLTRTAIRCMGYMNYFLGYPDRIDRLLRSLSSDVGRFISPDMYQAAQAARDSLSDCLSSTWLE